VNKSAKKKVKHKKILIETSSLVKFGGKGKRRPPTIGNKKTREAGFIRMNNEIVYR